MTIGAGAGLRPVRTRKRPESADVRAINCPACGSPLDLHAPTIESIVCPACRTQVDLTGETAQAMQRLTREPPLPPSFRIGQRLRLEGADYTVIGIQVWEEVGDPNERYIEYLLHHPKAGLVYIEEEKGWFSLAKPARHPPDVNAPALSQKQRFSWLGRTYTVFYRARYRRVFVEGEAPDPAKIGDTIEAVDAISPPYGCGFAFEGGEFEVFAVEHLDDDRLKRATDGAFLPPPRAGVSPYAPAAELSPLVAVVRNVTAGYALVALTLALFAAGKTGREIASFTFSADDWDDGALSEPFTVERTDGLFEITMQAPVDNSWVWAGIVIVGPDEAPVHELSLDVGRFSGVEDGESWSEGSDSDGTMFKLTAPGAYRLFVDGEGGGGAEGEPSHNEPITLRVYENVGLVRWYLLWAAALAVVPIAAFAWARSREARRWAPVTESDDDDDDD